MKLRLDSVRQRLSKLSSMTRPRASPKLGMALSLLRKVLSMVAVTLAMICILLTLSELLVHWIDSASGVDNYTDWTWSVTAPLIVSAVLWVIWSLLNLDRFRRRPKPRSDQAKLEIPDLD